MVKGKVKSRLLDLLKKSKLGREFLLNRSCKNANIIFTSFPKTGRTWCKIMVARYFQLYYNLPLDPSAQNFSAKWNVKKILFTHDLMDPLICTPEQLTKNKSKFYRKKIVLLIRNPKDTLVSSYFQKTKRAPLMETEKYEGTLSDYIYDNVGSLFTFLHFYKNWYDEKNNFEHFYLIRYEDLRQNPHEELKKLFEFIGVGIDEDKISQTVEFSKFENMQKMEKNNLFKDNRVTPTDKNDPESYKTRKGIVGGYVKYLNEGEINYIDKKTKEILPSFFGYSN